MQYRATRQSSWLARTAVPIVASLMVTGPALCPFTSDLAGLQGGETGLQGTVVLGLTDEPVAGAEVVLVGADRRTITDQAGRFYFAGLDAGEESVTIKHIGLSSMEVSIRIVAGQMISVQLAIVRPAFQMRELLVEVRGVAAPKMLGFETRRRRTTGLFIDREMIERRRPLKTSDLIDGERGARVVTDINGQRRILVRAGRSYCSPELYVDGVLLRGVWIDDYLPEHVEGLEFYPRWWDRPTAYRTPLEYDSLPPGISQATISTEGCGAILMWTRERWYR